MPSRSASRLQTPMGSRKKLRCASNLRLMSSVQQDMSECGLCHNSNPTYQARLYVGNIGVALGANSNGLCAIDIDADGEVEPFLALNPQLGSTLRTRGARGAQLWMKIIGEDPKFTKLKTKEGKDWGEWRCDGGQSV